MRNQMMDWNASTLWWVAAGALVVAELLTGTFYLLMLALGLTAAGLAALLGGSLVTQFVIASAVGGGAVAGWHVWRSRRRSPSSAANRDLNLDLGERVMVSAWRADGQATVQYRGATWQALHRGDAPPRPGPHVIVAVEAIHLVLSPIAP
jgi:membrane protein implicated in regulation of membrane protease activity